MRKSLLLAATLLAACSENEPHRTAQDSKAYDVQAEPAAPGVDVTAAPGVAFNYLYAFRLPNTRIAQVQEAHAQACEKLGLDKCRITGMRYRLVDQKDIEASLALRLDPAIARQFGKNATDAVKNAEGMLVDQEIVGEDVGTAIKAGERNRAQLQADLDKVEAELAGLAAKDPRRGDLVARGDELRGRLRSISESRAQGEEALAGTPMVFNYGSGSVVPGFDVRSPIRDALQRSADNFVGGLAVILVIIVTLVPWLVILALGIWLYRAARKRFDWGGQSYGDKDKEPASDA